MVANLQAWTKFITWQGPQVGKCFSEYYFLKAKAVFILNNDPRNNLIKAAELGNEEAQKILSELDNE